MGGRLCAPDKKEALLAVEGASPDICRQLCTEDEEAPSRRRGGPIPVVPGYHKMPLRQEEAFPVEMMRQHGAGGSPRQQLSPRELERSRLLGSQQVRSISIKQ